MPFAILNEFSPFELTEGVIFSIFATIIIACALGVITVRNPVYAVLLLVIAFFSSAALFVMQGAEFLGLLLVIVYVGAIAVLFLFVVMMLDIRFVARAKLQRKHLPLALLVAGLLLFELLAVVIIDQPRERADNKLTTSASQVTASQATANQVSANQVSSSQVAASQVAASKKMIAKPTVGLVKDILAKKIREEELAREEAAKGLLDNTTELGLLVYSEYLVIFEIAGLLLLLAMLGAIVLTHRKRDDVLRQNISTQHTRDEKARLVDIEPRSGV